MRATQIILLAFYLISCGDNPKPTEIFEKIDANNLLFTVARIDTINQRVFVVIDSVMIDDIDKIKTIIKQVDDSYEFQYDLNVSLFSNIKYVGYKDEFEDKGVLSAKEFFQNYLGEYNRHTKTYWAYPALPTKKVKYIFD